MGQNFVASASVSVRFVAITCFLAERRSFRSRFRSRSLILCSTLSCGGFVWALALAPHPIAVAIRAIIIILFDTRPPQLNQAELGSYRLNVVPRLDRKFTSTY